MLQDGVVQQKLLTRGLLTLYSNLIHYSLKIQPIAKHHPCNNGHLNDIHKINCPGSALSLGSYSVVRK